ncbi:MAG: hypothetical protein H6742_00955 [Alphaproteobacteria bacterium]|nr:hypothetical protein [Alphaproteobacteria bacterium]
MTSLLLLLVACNGQACVPVPPIDDPTDDDGSSGDSGQTSEDTGDTGPVDTGPPPPCDQPEVEPNNPYTQATELQLEKWACGTFSDEDDIAEIYTFENPEAGWLRVWARAFEIGSVADITVSLSSSDGPYGASRLSNPDSTDAELVFPVDDDYEFYVTLSEQYTRYGVGYRWELMASMVKPPTEWDVEEGDTTTNDTMSGAQMLENHQRVLGIMDSTIDLDWYAIELPDERVDITIDIDAWYLGSPADVRVELYKPDGTYFRGDSYSNESGYSDLDPYLTASPNAGGAWGIKILPEVDGNGNSEGGGGAAFWYVVDVSWEATE